MIYEIENTWLRRFWTVYAIITAVPVLCACFLADICNWGIRDRSTSWSYHLNSFRDLARMARDCWRRR